MKFSLSPHISVCSAAFEVKQFHQAEKQNNHKKEQTLMFPHDVIKRDFSPEAWKCAYRSVSDVHLPLRR